MHAVILLIVSCVACAYALYDHHQTMREIARVAEANRGKPRKVTLYASPGWRDVP